MLPSPSGWKGNGICCSIGGPLNSETPMGQMIAIERCSCICLCQKDRPRTTGEPRCARWLSNRGNSPLSHAGGEGQILLSMQCLPHGSGYVGGFSPGGGQGRQTGTHKSRSLNGHQCIGWQGHQSDGGLAKRRLPRESWSYACLAGSVPYFRPNR